ncbi:MAG: 2-C-methyl-D-erythritol 2,4-cyclodiphosphate synthase [Cyclobacteriaceae bacterium]
MNIRVGYGYDVHQLEEGREFWLGGIRLEHTHGAKGHSDADVLIHAICDALLGAANLRDIGFHFPDTDPQYKGIDSKKLLVNVMDLLRNAGYEFGNVDVTVCLEVPRVNPHIEKMRETLAEVMSVRQQDISIKATTSEKMGFVGRKEGVAAHCVALIYHTGGQMPDAGDKKLSSF